MRKIILYLNSTFNGVVTGDPSEDKTNLMVWTTKSQRANRLRCQSLFRQRADLYLKREAIQIF